MAVMLSTSICSGRSTVALMSPQSQPMKALKAGRGAFYCELSNDYHAVISSGASSICIHVYVLSASPQPSRKLRAQARGFGFETSKVVSIHPQPQGDVYYFQAVLRGDRHTCATKTCAFLCQAAGRAKLKLNPTTVNEMGSFTFSASSGIFWEFFIGSDRGPIRRSGRRCRF